jgi:hypothetical protein
MATAGGDCSGCRNAKGSDNCDAAPTTATKSECGTDEETRKPEIVDASAASRTKSATGSWHREGSDLGRGSGGSSVETRFGRAVAAAVFASSPWRIAFGIGTPPPSPPEARIAIDRRRRTTSLQESIGNDVIERVEGSDDGCGSSAASPLHRRRPGIGGCDGESAKQRITSFFRSSSKENAMQVRLVGITFSTSRSHCTQNVCNYICRKKPGEILADVWYVCVYIQHIGRHTVAVSSTDILRSLIFMHSNT